MSAQDSLARQPQSVTPLLDRVETPEDLRRLSRGRLRQLADELRHETIDAASVSGGHFGGGLGVVELTVALHWVFDTPRDRLIWDVGHQTYPHKILTGRREGIRQIRQPGGLYGFVKRAESAYDAFGTAHSSTSISAGLGMAVARDLAGDHNHVISVIGDGALSGGMAFEALNNAGGRGTPFLVVLNDNRMSIDPPVGGLNDYLAGLVAAGDAPGPEEIARRLGAHSPGLVADSADRAGALAGAEARPAEVEAEAEAAGAGTLFDDLGLTYLGPVDGHDIDRLVPILELIRDRARGPVLLHLATSKGRGYPPAEQAADRGHATAPFDIPSGRQHKPEGGPPSYSKVFASALAREAETDERIVAVTPAMLSGTGMTAFQARFPERCFDTAIAEQHCVTFAAGLACEGYKPFAGIYSTFLQRGYDQVIHDVALQSLPVRFCMDRAGLVGADGPTHAGSFDIAYLGCLPGFVLMAAADEAELMHMVATAAQIDDRPCGLRYPRGEGVGVAMPERGTPLEIGRGRVVREGGDVAILSYGTRLAEALAAAEMLAAEHGIQATVADGRFAKPLDRALIDRLRAEHAALVTVEEGSVGGFGSLILSELARDGALERGGPVRPLYLPDRFIPHGKPHGMYEQAGLNAPHIAAEALAVLGRR